VRRASESGAKEHPDAAFCFFALASE